jgi:hypothetical protein
MKERRFPRELVCCAGCGRDTTQWPGDVRDAYCPRCICHGRTHQFPEMADRRSFPPGYWFADPLLFHQPDDAVGFVDPETYLCMCFARINETVCRLFIGISAIMMTIPWS